MARAEIGEVRQRKDGKSYKKVDERRWVVVKEGTKKAAAAPAKEVDAYEQWKASRDAGADKKLQEAKGKASSAKEWANRPKERIELPKKAAEKPIEKAPEASTGKKAGEKEAPKAEKPKRKAAEVGDVRKRANGKTYKKVGPNKWEVVKEKSDAAPKKEEPKAAAQPTASKPEAKPEPSKKPSEPSKFVRDSIAEAKEFGIDHEKAAAATGLSGQMFMQIEPDGKLGIEVKTDDGIKAKRLIYKNEETNKLEMYNEYFFIPEKLQGGGKGTEIFAEQVRQAQALGVTKIKTDAARSKNMNGYYTWARLGYDGDVDGPDGETVRVSSLMRTSEGRKWWKENGYDFKGEFDLSPNSQSVKVLNAYMQEKEARR